jgi:outer membrane protein assembly factor BamD (BamD/ComL family)
MRRQITRLLAALAGGILLFAPAVYAQQGGELVWNGTEWVRPAPAEPGTPEGDLQLLRQQLEDGQYKDCVDGVEQFLARHGGSPLCEEAMLLAGQALMNRGRYWDAYKWFDRQLTSYPNGRFSMRALDREYQIAEAFLNGRKRRALKIFRVPAEGDGVEIMLRLSAHAPGTKIAERALLRVGDYYFDDQQYAEAVNTYDQFIKEHTNSPRRQYAMLQVAKAYLMSFRGVKWEVEPLVNAAVRFRLFAAAYPQAAERENISAILEEIHLTLAHKAYATAQFYERTRKKGAAAYYYQKVINEFGDTHWAQSAQGRLERLGPIEEPLPAYLQSAATNEPPASSDAPADLPPEQVIVEESIVETDVVADDPTAPRPLVPALTAPPTEPDNLPAPAPAVEPAPPGEDPAPAVEPKTPGPIRLEDLSAASPL